MSIASALPGLWAGCIAAGALAGVTHLQRPAVETVVAPQSISRTAPIITTLFGKSSAIGHVTLSLSYKLADNAMPTAPLAAIVADRLTQGALEQPKEFVVALEDENDFRRFVLNVIGTIDGYTIETVDEVAFHPFSGAE